MQVAVAQGQGDELSSFGSQGGGGCVQVIVIRSKATECSKGRSTFADQLSWVGYFGTPGSV